MGAVLRKLLAQTIESTFDVTSTPTVEQAVDNAGSKLPGEAVPARNRIQMTFEEYSPRWV